MKIITILLLIFIVVPLFAKTERFSITNAFGPRDYNIRRYSTSYDYLNNAISYSGKYVKSWYTKTGSDAVDTTDLNHNTIPDFVEELTNFTDSIIGEYIKIGYHLPPSDSSILDSIGSNYGGDSKIDIYFINCEYFFLGATIPIDFYKQNSYGVDITSSYVLVENDYKSSIGKIAKIEKLIIVHELFHMFQNGYRAFKTNESYTRLNCFMEATAVSMEERYFPDYNDYIRYVSNYYDATNGLSLFPSDFIEGNFDNIDAYYGSAIWVIYLRKLYGDRALLNIWKEIEKGENIEDAIILGMHKIGVDFFTFWEKFLSEVLLLNFNQNGIILSDLDDKELLPHKTISDTINSNRYVQLNYGEGDFIYSLKPNLYIETPYTVKKVYNNNYIYYVNNFGFNQPKELIVSDSIILKPNKLNIYPTILTQSNKTINLNYKINSNDVEIYNILGEKVCLCTVKNGKININNNFSTGVYFIKIKYGEKHYIFKFIKI